MSVDAPVVRCRLCGTLSKVLNPTHPGFQRPTTFAIAECCYCDVQFAEPASVESDVYDRIYEHARELAGYSRYAWYADQVLRKPRPLEWLAAQEEMYWFVRSQLELLQPRPRCVVEIGSGLGYLTFALRRAGYDAVGLELSARAVEAARARYGDLYRVIDVTRDGSFREAGADVVVMTEVLEHVPDPASLVGAIRRLLRPGGTALLTTPNKSAAPQGAYWLTENPPVHLWWFSETTLRSLAQRCGLAVEFGDFSGFRGERGVAERVRPAPPTLDETGGVVYPPTLVRTALKLLPRAVLALADVVRAVDGRRRLARVARQRSATMGIVLRRPASDLV